MDVINSTSFKTIFIDLGWDNLSPTEVEEWMVKSGISPIQVYAYCSALKANPGGVDDTTIAGITAGNLPYIREKFKGLGVLYT